MFRPALLLLGIVALLTGPAGTASPEEFVFTSSYSPPYSRQDDQGILDRILAEAFRRIGQDFAVAHAPAERGLRDANAGIADGVMARVAHMDTMYPNLRRIESATIPSRDFVACSLRELGPVREWADLRPYNVAYVRGWKIIENNVPAAKSVIAVESTERLFRILARGRVDVAINARLDGLLMARELGIPGLRVHEPPLASLSLYAFIHKDHEELAAPLGAAIDEMKRDGSFDAIYAEGAAGRRHGE